ncbi:MAG: response regulator [Anaerolineales bacterium]|nr:response regulator [Anaerolineales bacterium]
MKKNSEPIRILTVDDDEAITELLTLLLKTYGFEVYAANSGEKALAMIREDPPDVILLDLMMPGMNGWQVCSAIREFSQVPILILSALDKPGDVASALDAGADDYLIKPVSSSVLVAHINKLTRRQSYNSNSTSGQRNIAPANQPV